MQVHVHVHVLDNFTGEDLCKLYIAMLSHNTQTDTIMYMPVRSLICCLYIRVYSIIFLHMQQEHVLAELEEYARETPIPKDSASVLQTVDFLKACNSLFERGILGKHVFIKTMESPIITSMDEGYRFFGKWLDEHLAKGIYMCMCISPDCA